MFGTTDGRIYQMPICNGKMVFFFNILLLFFSALFFFKSPLSCCKSARRSQQLRCCLPANELPASCNAASLKYSLISFTVMRAEESQVGRFPGSRTVGGSTVFCGILLLLKSSHLNLLVRDFGRTENVCSGVKG